LYVLVLLHHVEGDFADNRKVLRTIAGSFLGIVFGEEDIQRPVQVIFHLPVCSRRLVKIPGRSLFAGDIEPLSSFVFGGFLIIFTDPLLKASFQRFCIRQMEKQIKGIVGGNAVGNIQKLPRPLPFFPAIVFDIISVSGPVNHSGNGDPDNGGQRMGNIRGMTVIGHGGKILHRTDHTTNIEQ
jgi:hypothetical protein